MSTRPRLASCSAWVTSAPSTGQKRTPSSNVRPQRGQLVTPTVLAPENADANDAAYSSRMFALLITLFLTPAARDETALVYEQAKLLVKYDHGKLSIVK